MPILWDKIRQGAGNLVDSIGTAIGLPETGISERIAGGATTNTSLGGQGIARASDGGQSTQPNMSTDNRIPMSSQTDPRAMNYQPSGGSSGGGGNSGGGSSGGGSRTKITNLDEMADYGGTMKTHRSAMQEGLIDEYGNDMRASAEAAKEASRRAAESRYQAQRGIAESAKGMAKEAYDWLVDAIGSNKKDLLEQVALQEKSGLADYQLNQEKTTADYDRAKQDILSTYRDLQTQQEKILRGSGMSSSSRSQEAALRLSNLLGKDLSTVRTNEADSLAMIGNALTKFKDSIAQTNVSIEREASGKIDKAGLDYNQQIKSIDNNLSLSAAEREEAYAQAEQQLARDTQAINQWAAGLKLQAEQSQMAMQDELDGMVSSMLDENGMLNSSLEEKRGVTNQILSKMGFTPLETNPTTTQPGVGVYQKARMSYKDKAALDAAMQAGEITPSDYNMQLQQMQMSSPASSVASANPASLSVGSRGTTSAQRDPLLSALFA